MSPPRGLRRVVIRVPVETIERVERIRTAFADKVPNRRPASKAAAWRAVIAEGLDSHEREVDALQRLMDAIRDSETRPGPPRSPTSRREQRRGR